MTLYAEGHRDHKAAVLGLYAQLKNIEWQLDSLRRDIEKFDVAIKGLIATLIKADADLEKFK